MAAPEAGAPSSPTGSSATRGRDWATTALVLVAVGVALGGLHSVLRGPDWWVLPMMLVTAILFVGALVRSFARHRLWALGAEVLTALAGMTVLFAPAEAVLGVIPTPATFVVFGELERAGGESIASQSVPATANPGIVYLLCLGLAALVLAIELFVVGARMPVLAGLPLLIVLLVPSLIDDQLHDPATFVLTAIAYLAILLLHGRRGRLRAAVAVAGAGLVAALVAPLALPSVDAATTSAGLGTGASLNPIIALGDDLRRLDPVIAYTYSSTVENGEYFRLVTLANLTGATWMPSVARDDQNQGLDAIGEVPGLGADVPTTEVTSEVTMGDVRTRWLPAPYAPRSITGLEGSWYWEGAGLAVGTNGSNARGQRYEVRSLLIAPTVEQLVAAGTRVPEGLEAYLRLPSTLPNVVARTADEVAGSAATHYEAALALQAYFRGGEFSYSETAPVEQGYDGSGAAVLADFLRARSGYCVHFSSAMAAMARTLGIPARIAVGFTAGASVLQGGERLHRVTTDQFHAWPELYFDGIGWVRFEPTPGRGNPPAFAAALEDDPTTPVDESVPPPVEPAPAATTPADRPEVEPSPTPEAGAPVGTTPSASGPWWLVLAGLVLLAVAPAAVRLTRRARRIAAVGRGAAAPGWAELRDTAADLGIPTADTSTPRQVATELAERLNPAGVAALERLTAAVEREAYAARRSASAGSASRADLRAVLRGLRRRAGWAVRAGALLLPRSLFAALLPAPPELTTAAD